MGETQIVKFQAYTIPSWRTALSLL